MTLAKKGLRSIVHNGTNYAWTIRPKPTYSQAAFPSSMTLAIQSMDTDYPTILHVTLDIDRPDNWILPHKESITPRLVGDIIEEAIENGWQQDAGGPAFEYGYRIKADER